MRKDGIDLVYILLFFTAILVGAFFVVQQYRMNEAKIELMKRSRFYFDLDNHGH